MTSPQEKPGRDFSGNRAPTEAAARIAGAPGERRKSKGRKAFWVGAVVLAVLAIVAWLAYHRPPANSAAPSAGSASKRESLPVPVVAGVVLSKDVPIYLDGLGTVQAFNTVTVHTRVDGQLMKVAFTEGQDVKTGEVLARLDPAPYQATFDQAAAKKAQDEAQLANARVDLTRYADLMKTESITQQIYDTQKALIAQLDATVKADQAAMESAKVNLDYTTIRSPIDGRTGIRQMDAGNIVHANDATGLVVLTQLHPISVVFTLPEQVFPKLRRFQDPAKPFAVLAVSRDDTNVLGEGVLAVIDNQIDPTTGTIKLKATFSNEGLVLWPGQFVNTRLLLTTRKDSPVVPASVVQRGPEGAFAFVIQEDLTVAMRPIKVAQIEGGIALIDEGLKPGERIVVDGQYKLQPGSHVKTTEAPGKSGAGGGAPGGKTRPGKNP
jgi:membrane fusion protein, multidrug efflux system